MRELRFMFLIKIVASFSSKVTIVCINYDDQSRFEVNVCVLNTPSLWNVRVNGDFDAALLF
jgi:hypothetical protein